MSLTSLFLMSMFTGNIVLTKFLGICPFIGTSKSEKNAVGMGLAVTSVVTVSSLLTYFFYHVVLVPTHTEYLKTLLFIFVIAFLVQLTEMILRKFLPTLHKALGLYLPLITTNCAVLGVILLSISNQYTLLETLVFSIGSSLGFTLVIYVFSTIREYLDTKNVPEAFKGTPIAFVIAAIMSILFSRYIGL